MRVYVENLYCLCLFIFITLATLLSAPTAAAEETSSAVSAARDNQITLQEIDTTRKIIEDMTDLDPIIKQESLEGLNQAALFLTVYENLQKKIKAQTSLITQAPNRIADLTTTTPVKTPLLGPRQNN